MKSLEELKKIKEKAKQEMLNRQTGGKKMIVVGMGTCGIAAGARDTLSAIMDELEKNNIKDVVLTQSGCAGYCEQEPIVQVIMDGKKVTYKLVDKELAKKIVLEQKQPQDMKYA